MLPGPRRSSTAAWKSRVARTAVGVGLSTEIFAFAALHKIEHMPVHTGTLKLFATGKGNASKAAMVQAAKDRGYNPQDDNEADACHLLDYGMAELKVA